MSPEGAYGHGRIEKKEAQERPTPYVVLTSHEVELNPEFKSTGLRELYKTAREQGGYVEYVPNPGFAISKPSEGPKFSDNFTTCQGQIITIKAVSGKRLSILSHQEKRTQSTHTEYADGNWTETASQFATAMQHRIVELLTMPSLATDPLDLQTVRVFSFGGRSNRTRDGGLELDEGMRTDLLASTRATLQKGLDGYAAHYGLPRAEVPNPIQLHLPREEGHEAGGFMSSYLYDTERDIFYVLHEKQDAKQVAPYDAASGPAI
jgi:hypothetical protein